MKIRFLGAHNEESRSTRLSSVLIDDVLAVDAGSLTCELTFEEQGKIQAILVSHSHYDHVRAIPAFGFSNTQRITRVFGTRQNLEIIASHLLDGIIYPQLSIKDNFLERPVLELCPLEPFCPIEVAGYEITALPLPHLIETVGYAITSGDSGRQTTILYATDSGPGLSQVWPYVSPQLIIVDTTFPSRLEKLAVEGGHLCPKTLMKELVDFRSTRGYLPRIAVIHRSPRHEEEIRLDIQKTNEVVGCSIEMPDEGDIISVE